MAIPRTRAFASFIVAGAALGAGACNLTPTAGTDTDTATEPTAGTTDTTGPTTGDGPTTGTEPTTGEPTTGTPGTTEGTTTGPGTTEGTTGTTTGVDLDDATIYDIQGGKVPEGSVVTVKGVVITSPVHVEDGIMYVQEPEGGELSGIAVYMYDEVVMQFGVKPGIVVDITGEYTEFFGESQLKVVGIADITQVGEGEPPAPEVVAAADIATGGAKAEAYEGVLVAVEDATVTNPNLDVSDFEVDGALRVTDFFLFAQNMDPQVSMGQVFQTIAGPLRFSFDHHKIAPRTVLDLVSDVVMPEEHTIYEIQQGMVPVLSPVLVKGAIVSSPLTFKKDGFFIQDAQGGEFSGIYVFIDTNVVDVKPGDVVDVEGVYDEFFEFSQIKISAPAQVKVTGMGAPPAPELVTEADIATGGPKQENYEGVLVTVENVQVAAVDMMFGEFELTDGLFVDDVFFLKADWPAAMAGDMFTAITGPLAWSFNESRLYPRGVSDIVK